MDTTYRIHSAADLGTAVPRYTIVDVAGIIVGTVQTAREATQIMRRYACPMRRYRTAEIPIACLASGYVGGIVRELIARGGLQA